MTTYRTMIDPARLAAIALFSAKNDCRYYLNGVCVEWLPNGRAILIATDGHRLGCMPATTEEPEYQAPPKFVNQVVLKLDAVQAAVKAHKHDSSWMIEMLFDDCAEVGAREKVGLMAHDMNWSRVGIDGRFPDWRRLVKLDGAESDKDTVAAPIGFNAEYMATFHKAAKLIAGTSTRYSMVAVKTWTPDMQIRVKLPMSPDFFGVVMPMRLDPGQQSCELPAWFTRRYEAPAAKPARTDRKPK